MNAVTHLEKVIVGEASAVTHLEKVIAGETSAVTYTEKVITGEAPPITHLQKVIAGIESPVTHLEYVWAGGAPSPTEHEYTGAVPYTFTADGSPLISWRISGNTVQTGTPTPDNPIMPQGTGERTGNLFDGILFNGIYRDANFNIMTDSSNVYKCCKIYLDSGTYTMSFTKAVNIVRLLINGTYTENVEANVMTYTFTVNNDSYFGITFRDSTSSSTVWDNSPIMLNTGSEALPYEPYGYKIPLTCAGQTVPVYLGQVSTVRRIKKWVLDGTEVIREGTENYYLFITDNGVPYSSSLCTHSANGVNVNNSVGAIFFKKSKFVYSSLADFKTYLQQQYAAGTPVTVWYILATPETAVVNEPLMKIGAYADEVSNVATIPTVNGSNTFDVDTSVKPSEIHIKYKGV